MNTDVLNLNTDRQSTMVSLIDEKLLKAEEVANSTSVRYCHEEVFCKVRKYLKSNKRNSG